MTIRTTWNKIQSAQQRLPAAVRVVLPMFLIARIGLALFAQASLRAFPPGSVPTDYLRGIDPVTEGIRGWLLGPWQRWDAYWYLRIATLGYGPADGTAAFFPLYPMLVQWTAFLLGGDHLLAAAAISHAACLLALILLYQITRQELDEDCARRAVLYQLFFPTAFFLFAPYTESLFTLWAIGCLLAARRGKWGWAGLCGFLASLTRVTGALLVLPVAVEMWSRHRSVIARSGSNEAIPGSTWGLLPLRISGRPRLRLAMTDLPRLLSLALIPLGILAYSLYLALAFGDPLLWLNSQELAAWDRSLTWPWETVRQVVTHLFEPLNNSVDAFFGLLFLALTVVALRRLPAAYGVYVGTSMLPALMMPRPGAPLMALPRYVLVLFPAFMVLAWLGRKPAWHRILLYTSAPLLAFFAALYVAWYWVA